MEVFLNESLKSLSRKGEWEKEFIEPVDGEASRIDDSVKKQLIFKLSYSQGPLGVKGKKKKKKKVQYFNIYFSPISSFFFPLTQVVRNTF